MTTANTRLILLAAVAMLGATVTACGADDRDATSSRPPPVSTHAPARSDGLDPPPPVSTQAPAPSDGLDPPTTRETELDPATDVVIQGMLDRWTSEGSGGVTAAIAHRGEPLALYASGVAGPDGAPIDVSDQLRVGSISKTFVSVMLLQLVDDGVLDLDAPVTDYVPDLDVADGVTVRQLLGHASGIPEYTDELFAAQILADVDRTWTPREVLAFVADRPAEFAPGERRAYSNTNYIVAGVLLETVTAASLADNLRTRIVEPLGLADTYFAPEPGREPIPGYTPDLPGGDTTQASYRAIETAAGAAGALVSTASDLAAFISALAGGELLRPDTFGEMTRDLASEQFGLGIFPSGLPSGSGIANGGAIPGFAAFMAVDVRAGDLFVILTNDDNRSIDGLAAEISATFQVASTVADTTTTATPETPSTTGSPD